uniref:Uncharacterized protein n=1 Tax=Panagrolaimus sp. ES5 TaxID=591445 RepID=A0AC34F7U9_9BILA
MSLVNASTLANLVKQPHFKQLLSLGLYRIPEIFAVENLLSFLNDVKEKKIDFTFAFGLSQEYTEDLHDLVDVLMESEVPNHIIRYRGQNPEKSLIIELRYGSPFFFDEYIFE